MCGTILCYITSIYLSSSRYALRMYQENLELFADLLVQPSFATCSQCLLRVALRETEKYLHQTHSPNHYYQTNYSRRRCSNWFVLLLIRASTHFHRSSCSNLQCARLQKLVQYSA